MAEDDDHESGFSKFYFGVIFGVLFLVFFLIAFLYKRWRLAQMRGEAHQPGTIAPPSAPSAWNNTNTQPVVGVVAPAPASDAPQTMPHDQASPSYPYTTSTYRNAPGSFQQGPPGPPPIVPPQYNLRQQREPYSNSTDATVNRMSIY